MSPQPPPPANAPRPRIPRGFRDVFARDCEARRAMIETIRGVYERYGFEPLETPAVEYVETLGKFLPESLTPEGGVFAWRDDDEEWIALRYDLTAPLSRVVAEHREQLPLPYRRYQVGPVWRLEKPGPGRFREFYQFDIDTVGSASMAADAEVCCVLADALEALGVGRGQYLVKVNNRKILNGVLDRIGLLHATKKNVEAPYPAPPKGHEGLSASTLAAWSLYYGANPDEQRMAVLRAIDKLDRLGLGGVQELLGNGRRDESGAFSFGAFLTTEQVEKVMGFLSSSSGLGTPDRAEVLTRLRAAVGESAAGVEGIAELEEMDRLLTAAGYGPDQVAFDPTVVRGLAYYTGPVFEATLTFEITDESGSRRQFGSVAGGGRYDSLVERFTGQLVPATGASIGVDRLLSALTHVKHFTGARGGPVVVVTMDKDQWAEYERMVFELRRAGIAAELYLGKGGLGAQLKYADRRNAPLAVIAGGNEFARNEVSIKDLRLGKELAEKITDRDAWRKAQPAQTSVPRPSLVEEVRKRLSAPPEKS